MSQQEEIQSLRFGRMIVAERFSSALPLENTTVAVQISASLASVAVSQRFGNPLASAAELEYLYPLPHEAAITAFELRIGSRLVKAELQEIEQARQTFEQARGQGKRAGLLEQRRPNLFALRLTNVQPGETILATVRYQQHLKFDADGYEFVYPMGLTPRYDQPGHPEEAQQVHAPLAQAGEKIGSVEITLGIDAGVQAAEPVSPSHPLEVIRLDERRFQVQLAGEHIPDRDFVLRFAVCGDEVRPAAWRSVHPDGDFFFASLLPPLPEEDVAVFPREFVFVLDRSGSMSGAPILQARNALRACLRTLAPEDSFRVLLFDDQLEWYRPEPCQVTQADIDAADGFLAGVGARGGTEIIAALQAALRIPADSRRTRLVVFLTDGAVSAEARTLEALASDLGSARVFTFGIGPSVNRALLSRMAGMGRGVAEFLQAEEDIEGAIIRFQDRVSMPVLTDVSIEWKHAKAWDVYPRLLPDLYLGQPLEISGRLKPAGSQPARAVIRGKRAGKGVVFEVDLVHNVGTDSLVARVWARARVDDLLDRAALEPTQGDLLRSQIIGLAQEFGLVTPYTAYVAVDEAVTSGGKPVLIQVAQPLPAGLEYSGFGAAMPVSMAPPMPAAGMVRMAKASRPMRMMADRMAMTSGSAEADFEEQRLPVVPTVLPKQEELLRWLGRTQQLDGSWNRDVEFTAAALLAFVRAGHTTRAGSYRVVVRRAAEWLSAGTPDRWESFLRFRALRELSEAAGEVRWQKVCEGLKGGLPVPANSLEQAALTGASTAAETGLNALRLAALTGEKAVVLPHQLSDDWWRVWYAAAIASMN